MFVLWMNVIKVFRDLGSIWLRLDVGFEVIFV